MPGSLSELQIYNMALDMIDEEYAATIDDTRAPVKWMRRNFPIERDIMLRRRPWGFAKTLVTVAREEERPPFDYMFRYPMPSDCLYVLPFVYSSRTGYTPWKYEIMGNFIYTNVDSPVNFKYVRRVTQTGLFDIMFCDALASRLALKISHFLTGKASYVERLTLIYNMALDDAMTADAIESTSGQLPYDDEILLVRE